MNFDEAGIKLLVSTISYLQNDIAMRLFHYFIIRNWKIIFYTYTFFTNKTEWNELLSMLKISKFYCAKN